LGVDAHDQPDDEIVLTSLAKLGAMFASWLRREASLFSRRARKKAHTGFEP